MSKTYIGIDIGKAGAISVIQPSGIIINTKMPMIKDEIDYSTLYHHLRKYTPYSGHDCHVVFEKLGVIFGTSKSTAFSMGHQSGSIEMACIASELPYTKVRAVDWQKEMFKGIPEILKANSTKRDTKAMALMAIKRIFPTIKLTFGDKATKPHDGLVDAVLMAEYARRNNL